MRRCVILTSLPLIHSITCKVVSHGVTVFICLHTVMDKSLAALARRVFSVL